MLGSTECVNQAIISMMAAQQKKLVEVFGIFESLLTQNPTNQDSELSLFFQTIWKTISKSKNRGL